MPTVLKSGRLDLLEPSGLVQACNGIEVNCSTLIGMDVKNTDGNNQWLRSKGQYFGRWNHLVIASLTDAISYRNKVFLERFQPINPPFTRSHSTAQRMYTGITSDKQNDALAGYSFSQFNSQITEANWSQPCGEIDYWEHPVWQERSNAQSERSQCINNDAQGHRRPLSVKSALRSATPQPTAHHQTFILWRLPTKTKLCVAYCLQVTMSVSLLKHR
jgi:hypothetical protein